MPQGLDRHSCRWPPVLQLQFVAGGPRRIVVWTHCAALPTYPGSQHGIRMHRGCVHRCRANRSYGVENQDVKIILVGAAALNLRPVDPEAVIGTIKAALMERGACS